MSDEYHRIEVITGTARRRSWPTEAKLRIIEESFEPGATVSSVARRNGVAPNLLYRWRRLTSERGITALASDESVVGASELRRLEERIRDLGRTTMEVEILREALARNGAKNRSRRLCRRPEALPDEAGRREALGVSRSNLTQRNAANRKPRGPYRQAGDEELSPLIRRLIDERPTYGYRRIARPC